MSKILTAALSLVLAGALAARAEEPKKDGGGISNQGLERELKKLDAQMDRAVELLKKHFSEREAFEKKMLDRQIGFESKMAGEWKTFIAGLEKTEASARKAAWKAFRKEKNEERRKFNEESKALRAQLAERLKAIAKELQGKKLQAPADKQEAAKEAPAK